MANKVARTYLRRADFERWGLSEGCPGCRYLRTGQGRQQAHSEACRRRIEGLLNCHPSGSTRLAAADERINVREDDPAGPRASCHHAGGIGRVP